MEYPENYLDIGHYPKRAFVWLHLFTKIEMFNAERRTHDSIWGAEALKHWRGRYECETARVSIVPPDGMDQEFDPPDDLIEMLKSKFGKREIEIWAFNPARKVG